MPRSALILFLLVAANLPAAEPVIRAINLRGLQVGGTTSFTIDGDDLGKEPKLLLPFPAKQTLKPGATDKKAIIDVALDDAVVPGYYHLRLVAPGGVSAPVIIGVDRLPQTVIAPETKSLPASLHGSVAAGAIAETKFAGKKGQALLIEVEAQRIGSKLRPVIHLYGPNKLQAAWGWGSPTLAGDARIEAALPMDGDYTLTLHDLEYAAVAPGHYRLKVGGFGCADQIFPPRCSHLPRNVIQNEMRIKRVSSHRPWLRA